MASTSQPTVQVRLEVFNEEDSGESHVYRSLTLKAPSYSINIGRGSRSGAQDLFPANSNAWFDSRVMSREHAILKAYPDTKTLTIEDVGSMHGTFVDGKKLSKYTPKVLHNGEAVVFGAEVSRGPETFPALDIDIFYTFEDNKNVIEDTSSGYGGNLRSSVSRNSFSVPDGDSEDEYSSELEPDALPTAPKHNPFVPESVVSNGGSLASDDDDAAYEPWGQTYCSTFESKKDASDSKDAHNGILETTGGSSASKTSPADIIMWSRCPSGDVSAVVPKASNSNLISQVPAKKDLSAPPQQAESRTKVPKQSNVIAVDVDADEEQSESDYGDDMSVDLFDEDFHTDDSPHSDRRPAESSLSSQSPVLSSMPSKVELAARQATLTEATKPVSPIVTQAPAALRAPSPSDAAMPKARTSYLADNTLYSTHPTGRERMFVFDSHDGEDVANGLPTDILDEEFMPKYGYTTSQGLNYVQDSYQPPAPYPMEAYDPSFPALAQHSIYAPPLHPWGHQAYPVVVSRADLEAGVAPTPASSFVTIKTAPRVAIKDLVNGLEKVDDSQEHDGNAFDKLRPITRRAEVSNVSGTKRKAEQMSQEDWMPTTCVSETAAGERVDSSVSQEQQNAQVGKTLVSTTSSQSQTEVWGPASMIQSIDSAPSAGGAVGVEGEARPKKKMRSDFYKYAAGAVGGMAIGAVGVVAALVALPPDFFV